MSVRHIITIMYTREPITTEIVYNLVLFAELITAIGNEMYV